LLQFSTDNRDEGAIAFVPQQKANSSPKSISLVTGGRRRRNWQNTGLIDWKAHG